jgi:hypothetical protein
MQVGAGLKPALLTFRHTIRRPTATVIAIDLCAIMEA